MDMFIYNFRITIVFYASDEGDVGKNGFKSNLDWVKRPLMPLKAAML